MFQVYEHVFSVGQRKRNEIYSKKFKIHMILLHAVVVKERFHKVYVIRTKSKA